MFIRTLGQAAFARARLALKVAQSVTFQLNHF